MSEPDSIQPVDAKLEFERSMKKHEEQQNKKMMDLAGVVVAAYNDFRMKEFRSPTVLLINVNESYYLPSVRYLRPLNGYITVYGMNVRRCIDIPPGTCEVY